LTRFKFAEATADRGGVAGTDGVTEGAAIRIGKTGLDLGLELDVGSGATQGIDRQAADNGGKPGHRLAAARVVPMRMAPDPYKSFLHDVVGTRSPSADAESEPIELPDRLIVQLAECRTISARNANEALGKVGLETWAIHRNASREQDARNHE
jgi:hypothetical protein